MLLEFINFSTQIDIELKFQIDTSFQNFDRTYTMAHYNFINKLSIEEIAPLEISLNQPNSQTVTAMMEAERISKDSTIKGYIDLEELFDNLES